MFAKISAFVLSILFSLSSIYAQNTFYGTTSIGGPKGGGAIFKVDSSLGNYETVFGFESAGNAGEYPIGDFLAIEGSNILYGTTRNGGIAGKGILYQYDQKSAKITKLFDFTKEFGESPTGYLLHANNDNIYGITSFGGTGNGGSIFQFDRKTKKVTKLIDLGDFGLFSARGKLIQTKEGKIIGTCYNGGEHNDGAIFEYDIEQNKLTTLYSFQKEGIHPTGMNVLVNKNQIVGTTHRGKDTKGDIFIFSTKTHKISFHHFSTENGTSPYGPIVYHSKTKSVYGVTEENGKDNRGTIFSFHVKKKSVQAIHHFSTEKPHGYGIGRIEDNVLIGATGTTSAFDAINIQRAYWSGIYSFNLKNNAYKDVVRINTPKNRTLILIAGFHKVNDEKFVVTSTSNKIFEINLSSGKAKKMTQYNVNTGYTPSSGLCLGKNGKLYGTTKNGGTHKTGTLFEFNPKDNSVKVLGNFNKKSGQSPYGNLLLVDNKLYGTTTGYSNSTIYCFDLSTNTFKTLHKFSGLDGEQPLGGLVLVNNNTLLGMCEKGGNDQYYGGGSIFTYHLPSQKFHKVLNLKDFNISMPETAFTKLNDSLFLGLSEYGGIHKFGCLFSYNAQSKKVAILHSFDRATGIKSRGYLAIQDSMVYGINKLGGKYDFGTIYSYNLSDNSHKVLQNLKYKDGTKSYMGLQFIQKNVLLGMGWSGGNKGLGTLYQYNLNNNQFSLLKHLTEISGNHPEFPVVMYPKQ